MTISTRRHARSLDVLFPAAFALAAALAGPQLASAEENAKRATAGNPLRTVHSGDGLAEPSQDGGPAADPSVVINGTAVTFEIGESSEDGSDDRSETIVAPAVLTEELVPMDDAEIEPLVDAEALDPADLELEESDLSGELPPTDGHSSMLGEDTDNPAFARDSAQRKKAPPPPLRTPKDPLREIVTPKSAEELEAEDLEAEDVGAEELESEDVGTEDAGAEEGEPQPLKRAVKPILVDPLPKQPAAAPTIEPTQQNPQAANAAAAERMRMIDATLRHYMNNPESAAVRSPWAVMHAILPFGRQAELWAGPHRVNAIEWMCDNHVCRTQTIFSPVGRSFRPNVGGGVQGHQGQFLAILAQSKTPSRTPLKVSGRDFTVSHLVQYEMATCRPRSELTFKLIGLSYYLGTQQTWRSADRQTWNVERLVGEELVQPINGAACGGTHRLMGLSFAVAQRREERLPLSGNYGKAKQYIDDYMAYTWSLQNPDGSFSTNWFESRGMDPDDERKVQTTGHILEWLIFASEPNQLRNAKVEQAVDYLISQIYDRREHAWPIGPRGHALRAVALYQQKMQMPTVTTPARSAAPPRSASRTPVQNSARVPRR